MLVGGGCLGDGIHMHASLVGEGGASHERRTDIRVAVGQFVDKERDLAQAREVRDHGNPHLELQAGNDGGEVAVAGTFTVAVHRPLDMDRSSTNGGKRIGRPHAAIVVGVDADLAGEAVVHRGRDRGDLVGHRSAVGVAEHQHVGTGLSRCSDRRHGERGIILVTVKEMLGIVDHLAPLRFQIADTVADHGEIFRMGDPEHLVDLEFPAFAEDGDDRGSRLEQLRDLGIIGCLDAGPPGASEGCQLGASKVAVAGLGEKCQILGV